MAGDERIPIGSKTLHKRLAEQGLLQSRDRGDRLTVRRTLAEARREVLHVLPEAIYPDESDQSAQTDQSARPGSASKPTKPTPAPCGRVHGEPRYEIGDSSGLHDYPCPCEGCCETCNPLVYLDMEPHAQGCDCEACVTPETKIDFLTAEEKYPLRRTGRPLR
jgi:hypothetical protein